MKIKLQQLIKIIFVLSFMLCLLIPIKVQAATKISAPNITIKTNDDNPYISWKSVKGATGYKIFRKTAGDKSWVKVATTSKNSYTDKKWCADEGTQIAYMVKAYVKRGGETTWSSASKTKKWTVPEVEMTAAEIYENCAGSVVLVVAELPQSTSQGSGFFIDKSTLVTNYHVIDGAYNIYICPGEDEKYNVSTILGYDKDLDIAILKVDKYKGDPLPINTHTISVGDTVYAIGNPIGLTNTFSNGIVTTSSRKSGSQDLIQTNADITHGSSGGALINAFGEVIGITSSGYDGTLLNFAINISQIELVDTNNPIDVKSLYNSFDVRQLLYNLIMSDYSYYDSNLKEYAVSEYEYIGSQKFTYRLAYNPERDKFYMRVYAPYTDIITSFDGNGFFFVGGYYHTFYEDEFSMYVDISSATYTGDVSELVVYDYEDIPNQDAYDVLKSNINLSFRNYLYWLSSYFSQKEPRLSLYSLGFESFK